MKKGKSLVELAKTLEDIRENSKDFLVPAAKLTMNQEANLEFATGEKAVLEPTDYAHGQIAQYTGVPKTYYDKLKGENPKLLSRNVNHGLEKHSADKDKNGKLETRLVRTYRNNVRAFLSSSYRRLDSYDMAQAILPILVEKQFEVVSSEITDSRTYIKALTPKITADVKPGDTVQYGLLISNSDVGAGSVRVEPMIYRLVCSNGLISNSAIRKFHIGKTMAAEDITELLTEETLSLTDQAFWAQVRDIVYASMEPKMFETEVNRIREATSVPIKNFDLPLVVELSMKTVGVEGELVKQNIIQYLANGADGAGLTKWGLVNGFTYAAQSDIVSYDQSIQLERAGSKILDLAPSQWKRIAE